MRKARFVDYLKIAVVRIRGSANVPSDQRRILEQLGLGRPNNMVLVEDNETYLGMLQKVRHLVTFGPPSVGIIEYLLRKRGQVKGYGRLTDQYVMDNCGFSSISDLAQKIHDSSADLKDVPMLNRTFRCSPPSKGYRNVKRSFKVGGSLGNRGEKIDNLLKRMI
jgi:large subunit ribosomal protein L30